MDVLLGLFDQHHPLLYVMLYTADGSESTNFRNKAFQSINQSINLSVMYGMVSYDSIAWYCMLLQCWLRRAGCVSQDAYILHFLSKNGLLFSRILVPQATFKAVLMAVDKT